MAKTRAARAKVAYPQKGSGRDLMPVLLVVVLSSVFGGLGVYHTVGGLREVTHGLRTMSWKEGAARVLDVEMVEERFERRQKWHTVDVAHVRYQFEVLGRSYEGNTIHFDYNPRKPVDMHQSLYVTLKATKLVRVFYNEQHPDQNALCRGVDPLSIQRVCVGVFLILFVSLMLFMVVLRFTRSRDYLEGIVTIRWGERTHDTGSESQGGNSD
jgi:hypothetical protein